MTQHRPVLLVEDNPDDELLATRAFQRSRLLNPLVIVRNGAEALEYLRANALPAVMLLDLQLPLVDGKEVLRRVRADPRTRRLPVVVLTASREEQDLFISYDLGANSYIRKPVDFTQFAEAVRLLGMYWLVLNEPPPA